MDVKINLYKNMEIKSPYFLFLNKVYKIII